MALSNAETIAALEAMQLTLQDAFNYAAQKLDASKNAPDVAPRGVATVKTGGSALPQVLGAANSFVAVTELLRTMRAEAAAATPPAPG